MRYYDTKTHQETSTASKTTIPMTDKRVADFFKPVPNGYMLEIIDNMPKLSKLHKKSKDEIKQDIKKDRFQRLEKILNDKTSGLKKIAIEKEYMTNVSAIDNQYKIYEEMYQNAKNGLYDKKTSESIIEANRKSKEMIAGVILLLNEVRSSIENGIMNDAKNIDSVLDLAESVSLIREDLTDEKISEIKSIFGISK